MNEKLYNIREAAKKISEISGIDIDQRQLYSLIKERGLPHKIIERVKVVKSRKMVMEERDVVSFGRIYTGRRYRGHKE